MNLNERSAKAESVRDDNSEDGESQCSQGCPGHAVLLKESPPLLQTVRAIPKNETSGNTGTR